MCLRSVGAGQAARPSLRPCDGRRVNVGRKLSVVRMPTGPESVALKLPDGTPIVELIRTAIDTNGESVEVMLAIIAGDMITFNFEFPVPD